MKSFSYRACATDGTRIKGTVTAEHPVEAVRSLAAEGLTVVDLKERRCLLRVGDIRLWCLDVPSEEERIALFEELAALLAAGIPVHEALGQIAAGTDAASAYGRLVAALHADVLCGTALSQAMERRPRVFSPSVVGMVRAGEESGTLDHIFAETAAFLTEAHTLRESMKSALAYPLFLLVATGFSIVLMTMFILPVFASLLRDLGAEPPLPTRLLLQAADVFTTHPYLVPGAAVLLLVGMIALVRVPALRYYLDVLLLCVPVLGRFLRFSAWGMILRTLAILMHSGIRLDCAVHLARSVAGNCVLVRSLGRVEERLMQGRTLAYALAQEGQLPQLLQGMLAAGETAGDLERLLRRSADYCKHVSKQLAARIEALAEPIMIVVIGLVIFFGVLSFLLPVFEAMDRMM